MLKQEQNVMASCWIVVGSVLGGLAVAMGAFGAHGLEKTLESNQTLAVFNTAAQYHMYHALALLAVGLLGGKYAGTSINVAGWAFVVGIALFSGSLYILAITGIKWLGAITPFGGVAFLVGWVALAMAAYSSRPAGVQPGGV